MSTQQVAPPSGLVENICSCPLVPSRRDPAAAADRQSHSRTSPGAGRLANNATTTADRVGPTTSTNTMRRIASATSQTRSAASDRSRQSAPHTSWLSFAIDRASIAERPPARPRVRPSRIEELRHREGPARPPLAGRPRRDRQMRRRLCKLSSSANGPSGRLRACGGSSTVEPRPSKAMMRVRFPSAASTGRALTAASEPQRGTGPDWRHRLGLAPPRVVPSTPTAAPPPAPPRPHPPAPAAARGPSSCRAPHPA
jgi:hypothetical protein